MMNIQPIRSDADLSRAFARLEEIWAAENDTPETDELEVLSILIEKYENEHYPIGPSDPIEAIKFRMEQQGLTQRDLEPFIGTSGRVSEVLNGKRNLSLNMIKRLHQGLKIPYESLIPPNVG
ncbi:helix-turn-helix domain-containing protein [Halomonas sp. HK25]|uniref:helix-turn-helix domain-containing protein n=1 Tax=Halomonas sp. HK25 TaxID=3394321 RepID=UPI0039FCE289